MKRLILLCGLLSFFMSRSLATTYYLDAVRGNDSGNGNSVSAPWKSLNKLKGVLLKAGDKVLLKRGCTFIGELEISAQGTDARPVVISSYGRTLMKPRVKGLDNSLYAVRIYNSTNVTLRDIEIVNTGRERLARRTGLKVESINYGISRNIVIDNVTIRDVNGSLVKEKGGGSGIWIVNGGKEKVSTYENMLIQNCHIVRCSRNAMIWDGYIDRHDWHPSHNLIVRNNLIEQVPGDGIVPIGFDNVLIEYNIMRDCPEILPETEAAAGFWPWSCDNTVIQFNEVSGHKAPWDAQGYDSDYNCRNTVIRYNYSHDNYGGMVLVCNSGEGGYNIGNLNTVVKYNISIGDGIRPTPARGNMFSPAIHIAGPVKNTLIERNIIHLNKKANDSIDNSMITADTWNGYSDSTFIRGNVFYAAQPSGINMTKTTHNEFSGNYYLGKFNPLPQDKKGKRSSSVYKKQVLKVDSSGHKGLEKLMRTKTVCGVEGKFVDKNLIERFFEELR